MRTSNLTLLAAALAAATLTVSCKDDTLMSGGNGSSDVIGFSIVSDDGSAVSSRSAGGEYASYDPLVLLPADAAEAGGKVDSLYLHPYVCSNPIPESSVPVSRGTPSNTQNFAEVYDGSFRVKAYFDGNEYMNDEITQSAAVWTSSGGTRYWPDGKLRFFAVAPYEYGEDYEENNGKVENLKYITTGDNPQITFSYTVPGIKESDYKEGEDRVDAELQPDLIFAYNELSKDGSTDGTVPLFFHHALAAIRFQVGDIAGGTVKSISIKNVHGAGNCTVTFGEHHNATADQHYKADFEWDTENSEMTSFTQTFNVEVDGSDGSGSDGNPTTQPVTDNNPETTFMMIPQDLPDDAQIEVVLRTDNYEVKTLVGNIKDKDKGLQEWKAGDLYTYTISTKRIYLEPTFEVTQPSNFSYLGGSDHYEVISYGIESYLGDTEEKELVWVATFVQETETGEYIEITQPDWIEDFTSSGNGSKQAMSFDVKVKAQDGEKSNIHDKNLQVESQVANYNLSDPSNPNSGEITNTANCYIINAPGNYRLPLVYGNAIKNGKENTSAYMSQSTSQSSSVLKNFLNHLNQEISSPYIFSNKYCPPKKASLVWQDAENLLSGVQLSDDNKWLTFNVEKDDIKQGNAIVAVKDTNGYIMWSWHIWVTDYKLGDDDKLVTNYSGSTCTMMPINIGWCYGETTVYEERSVKVCFTQKVTGETKIITLTQTSYEIDDLGNQPFFQWGRKDPMPAAVSDGDKPIFDADGTSLQINILEGPVDIGTSIKNPNRFYCGTDWCEDTYYNLWNVNTSSNKNTAPKVTKTIYDPSPIGYCLPQYDAFTGFTVGGDNTSNFNNIRTPYTGVEDVNAHSGYEFYCSKGFDHTIFFPLSGYREHLKGNASVFGLGSLYWTAMPSATKAYSLDLHINANGKGIKVYPNSTCNTCGGFAIRSVRESE